MFPGTCKLVLLVLLPFALAAAELVGRVVEDHSGEPLASARVRVLIEGASGLAAELETGPDGRFEALNLAAGPYRLEISKPNYLNAAAGPVAADGAVAGDVTVRLVKRAVVTGAVIDAHGAAVQGAMAAALIKSEAGLQQHPGASAVSGARGEYRLHGLPLGEYVLGVSLGGLRQANRAGAFLYPDHVNPRYFTVRGGEEYRTIDFRLPPSATHQVSGRVEIPEPKRPFAVSLVPAEQPALSAAFTATQGDGRFGIGGVPPGAYELLVSGPAIGLGNASALLGPNPMFGRMRVDVTGQDVEGVSIAVEEGRPVDFILHSNSADSCPSSAAVLLNPLENWGAAPQPRIETALGEPRTAEGLAPGRYRASLDIRGGQCFGAAVPEFDLASGSPGAIPLHILAATSIEGRLTAHGGRPEQFVVVLLSKDDPELIRAAWPDSRSRFSFTGLHPGPYLIAARSAAGARWVPDAEAMFEIEAHEGTPTEIELPARPSRADSP